MDSKEVGAVVTEKDLENGDLLFSSHPYCNLSQAIDLVTQTGEGTHYSHVAIVEIAYDVIKVYHSSPKHGVYREALEHFLHPDEEENTIMVYRLKEEYLQYINPAINLAKEIVGAEYNHSFIFSAPGFYCSEFIYRIFAPWKIFELVPMTFKDPEDQTFPSHWVEYYKHLDVSIPEHQPGCNPNGMAASEKLQLIGELKFQ
jgi:hypothetical protein